MLQLIAFFQEMAADIKGLKMALSVALAYIVNHHKIITELLKKMADPISKDQLDASIAQIEANENSLEEVFGTLSGALPQLAEDIAALAAKAVASGNTDLADEANRLAAVATKQANLTTAVQAALASVQSADQAAGGSEGVAPAEPAPSEPAPDAP